MLATTVAFIKKNSGRLYRKEILAGVMIIIAIYFFRKQRHELNAMIPYLKQSSNSWMLVATIVTALFIFLQSAMYVASFRATGISIKWMHAIELFLKRNLLGIFLPGGGVGALAYVPANVRRNVKDKQDVHRASGIFAYAGIVSTFLVGLPVLLFNTGHGKNFQAITGLILTACLIIALTVVFYSIKNKKKTYQLLERRLPNLAKKLHDLTNTAVDKKFFTISITASIGVELCGIAHMYLAMMALGAPASLQAAALAYIISLLLMVASPFLKGLGAVELSIVYVLSLFGYPAAEALAIALVFRAFEFWLPMVCGLVAFLLKGKHLFVRIAPAVSIFILGIINILSVVTPPIKERIKLVRSFLPSDALHVTNLFVLFTGVALMITAAFLIKGLRNAWWLSISIALFSVFGHLVKAFDYEEATIALAVFTMLLFTRKHYRVKANRQLLFTGIKIAIACFISVLAIGYLGFYFLEKKHFGVDFTWKQSIENSIRGFLLLDTSNLKPLTAFGRQFLFTFQALGLFAWAFFFYSFIRPCISFKSLNDVDDEKKQSLLNAYGSSAVDYFKLADDKEIFYAQNFEGFIAFRVSGSFAIALEEPVCAPDKKGELVKQFDQYCRSLGLKTAYYRVDEHSLNYFKSLRKRNLLIGQEAVLHLEEFDLGGRSRKSLRNGLNSLAKKGYTTLLCAPQHDDLLLAEMRQVSDEWLIAYDKKEMAFSQGYFDEEVLRDQEVIATFDSEGKMVAFLNIIPDFAPGECTYDLIRKTANAPGGCMDALIVELINYAKAQHFSRLNLGLVPMSGISQPENPAEHLMQYAYKKIKRFRQYQGLRAFKEKFATEWCNKYLIYESDFDLIQLPVAIKKVMKPQEEISL